MKGLPVLTERKNMEKKAKHSREWKRESRAAGILVCGDLERAFRHAKDYWIIDGAIAAGNICLCAHALGFGSVWPGT